MKKKPLVVMCGAALLLLLALLSFRTRSAVTAIAAESPARGADAASVAGDAEATARGEIKSSTNFSSAVPAKSSQSNAPSARFERARICHEAAFNKRDWEGQLKSCRQGTDKDFLDRCQSYTEGFDKKIDAANQVLAQCSAVPAEIEEDFYRTSIEAAKAGDATAQLCYLQSDLDLHRPFERSELEYYHSVDADYVNEALTRGDWRMVALMGKRYRHPAHHPTMRGELTGGDPYTLYQMNRLLSLGADGQYKRFVDMDVDRAKAQLTEEQMQQADDWAALVYEKHFALSPRLTEAPTICESHN